MAALGLFIAGCAPVAAPSVAPVISLEAQPALAPDSDAPRLPSAGNPDPTQHGIPVQWGLDDLALLSGYYQGELVQPEVLLCDSNLRLSIVGIEPTAVAVGILRFRENPTLNWPVAKTLELESSQDCRVLASFHQSGRQSRLGDSRLKGRLVPARYVRREENQVQVHDSRSQGEWWQTGVIYQIYPRSFRDTTGNGIGDLPGITSQLDYLSCTLGVDAIWLSPFYPSPMADFGYDVADYTDVDPLFGDLATFDELLAQAHRRDLKVIIDLVPNHTSEQHPWFVESRSSCVNPRRDWYVWRDAKPNGGPPNNWLSVFGGPAWEWDPRTEQYYLHSFLKEQPDLNWRNPAVKAAMFDIVHFWLDRGVDGFRIDVAHYIMKDPEFRDNPVNTSHSLHIHKSLGEYDSQLHLHDKGHPDVHTVYREFRRLLDGYSEKRTSVAIGEIHIFDWQEWASYYGQSLDELHMPFNFRLLGVPWRAQAIRQVVDSLEQALPPGAWPNYVLGNHDESRLASRYGQGNARLAAMLLLTLRGTPTLYYGDEIGMTDVPVPHDRQVDPWGLRVPGLGRDPCRTPMQWNPERNAGFSPPDVAQLWLPLAADYRERNVERQLDDPSTLLNLYRSLLAYRRTSTALQLGSYEPVDSGWDDCFVFLRESDGERILVALNLSSLSRRLTLAELSRGKIAISTDSEREEEAGLIDLELRSHEGVIIEAL